MNNSHVLADVILVVHALLVLFNVGALPLIWIGYFRGWTFVRNFSFRIIHLLLIGVVAAESVFGMMCPLTTWESELRGSGAQLEGGFIAYWLHRLLFFEFSPWVFTIAYVLFFLLVAFTFYWVPPHRPGLKPSR
jgi:hypothetical protein